MARVRRQRHDRRLTDAVEFGRATDYRDRVSLPRIPGALLVATLVALALLPACSTPEATLLMPAPGVRVREVPLGTGLGANQGWIEFETFALVVDSNVLHDGATTVAELGGGSETPVRFLVNTHAHGDHSHGNAHLTALGARVIAATASRSTYDRMERDFYRARDEVDPSYSGIDFAGPSIWFDRTLVLDDGTRRVELMFLGPAHTEGDTLVWLPDEGILFTGDVAANQHLTYLGEAYYDSWIEVLEKLEQLPVRVVIPGHGPPGDLETLRTQRAYLTDLRAAIDARIDAGMNDADEIADRIELEDHPLWREREPWYRRMAVMRRQYERGGP